ncbi:Leucine Rich Repeat [Seminavis robusta]|uniref:Leucine Rich Repeat n=1 Tax=Seminavis robusta TaxID=568900 RepID=A0A9N8EJR5_9STRA|nr:Leucine Rich Repeat [Seminavis robusta]|eukprot:Sro1191_g250890.1 Leucine Rich Repeat (775) ;mRNA; r:6898-9222
MTVNESPSHTATPAQVPLPSIQEEDRNLVMATTPSATHSSIGGTSSEKADSQVRMNVLLQTGVLSDQDDAVTSTTTTDTSIEHSESGLTDKANSTGTSTGTCTGTCNSMQKENAEEEATRLQMDVLFQVGILSSDHDRAGTSTETTTVKKRLPVPTRDCNASSNGGPRESYNNNSGSEVPPAPQLGRLVQGTPIRPSVPGAHRATPLDGEEPQSAGSTADMDASLMFGIDPSEQEQQERLATQLEEGLPKARPVMEEDGPRQSATRWGLQEHEASQKRKYKEHLSVTANFVLMGLCCVVVIVVAFAAASLAKNKNSDSPVVETTTSIINQTSQSSNTQSTSSMWTWDLPFAIPNNSTVNFLYHDTQQTSAQFKAYNWMKADPYLHNYTEKRLLQRFALATFYYATNGENWTRQGGETTAVETNTINTLAEFTPNKTLPLPSQPPPSPHQYLDNSTTSINNDNAPTPMPHNLIVHVNVTSEKWLSYEHSECDWFSTGLTSPYKMPACDENGNFHHLGLTNANLQGTLPPELGLLTSLRVIGFGRNRIEGPIVTEIGNLRKLEGLHLSGGNQFTGIIPSEIGLLSDTLTAISVNENALTGKLPMELWKLSNLSLIKISRTKLSATLPSNIGHQLSKTKLLMLQGSQFSGTLPNSLGLMTDVVNADFGQNRFVGSLPTELSQWQLLTRFSARNNQLTGKVPSELGLLPFLRDLWLEINPGISGSLPANLEQLNITLISLRIKGTGITGTIPAGLCAIEELSFDCSETLCGCEQCRCQ